jgi:hypothetical protein
MAMEEMSNCAQYLRIKFMGLPVLAPFFQNIEHANTLMRLNSFLIIILSRFNKIIIKPQT